MRPVNRGAPGPGGARRGPRAADPGAEPSGRRRCLWYMAPPYDVPASFRGELPRARWRLADIDFGAIDRGAVAGDTLVFRIVFLASMVETASDLYAANLVEHFATDAEVSGWLRNAWQHEEVQHGHALRAYVEHVWPGIDWAGAYDRFFAAYSRTCTVGELEPARALELAARCMVETGTATLYGALRRYAPEPVLRDLAGRIYADEVRHYKYFYRHFLRYQRDERHSRWRIGRTLLGRLVETRTGDGYHAYRELHESARAAGAGAFEDGYREFTRSFAAFIRAYAPGEMPIRMGLKPLRLPPRLETWLTRHGASLYYGLWAGRAAPSSGEHHAPSG